MFDLKKLFKQKNYQINPLILKSIKTLNLTLNEFLLIVYFINEEPFLDLVKIKEVLGFSDEEILNIYSDLLTKGLIEVIVEKKDTKVSETISLELFYDKLVLNGKEDEKKNVDVFSKFEREFGRTLSPIEYERINSWISSGVSEEMITNALNEAVINGSPNVRYIDRIIYEWSKNKGNSEREEYKELFDYDWLGDSDE